MPTKIFDQKNRGHCSGYSILAYLYNSHISLDYDQIDRDMQALERDLMSFMWGFNFFKRIGVLKNFQNLSLEETKEILKNGYPVIIDVGFFGKPDNNGIIRQDFTRVMGWHVICAVSLAPEKGENVVKFQNSWGANWGENGFGYIELGKFNYYILEM